MPVALAALDELVATRPAVGHGRRAPLPVPASDRAARGLRVRRRGVAAGRARARRRRAGAARGLARRPRPPRRALRGDRRRSGRRAARRGRARGGGTRAAAARSGGSMPPCGSCRERGGDRLSLLVPLATALAATGQLERALATLLDALALIPPELGELRVRVVAACAACENLLGRHRAAHERLLQAQRELRADDSAAAAALRVELAADALYDTDFEAMAVARPPGIGDRGRARGSARSAPSRRPCCVTPATPRGTSRRRSGRAGEAAAALDALDDGAPGRTTRGAVLPRLRRVLLRALRRRDPAPAAWHRRLARRRPGPVRRADDGWTGARARGPRAAARRRSTRPRARSRRGGSPATGS